MRERMLGYAFCALAMVTVGSTVVASKVIGAGLPPFSAAALRFAIALPAFAAAMAATGTPWPRSGRHDAILLVLQSALGSVGYTVLLVLGLRYTEAASAGVVAGTLTAVSSVIAVLVLGERPGRRMLVVVALACAGVLVVTASDGPGAAGPGSNHMLGNGLVLGAVVCEGLFLLLNKRLHRALPPLAMAAAMTTLGLLLAIPGAVLERPWAVPWTGPAVLAVTYYALVPTVLGFLLWYAGAARLTGMQASLTTALLPVTAVLLSAALTGERVTAVQIGGMACVVGAVLVGALTRLPR